MTDVTDRHVQPTDQRLSTGPASEPARLGFGARFTRHLAAARYADGGWSRCELAEFADFAMSPAAMALHYGQAIFEGLKAFRTDDGSVLVFRVDDCAARFDRSATRMGMPPLPEGMFTDAVRRLVTLDAGEVPSGSGAALYVRPVMFADEASLAVRPSTQFSFLVLCSPVDSFFRPGRSMIDAYATHSQIRAAAGGTGDVKCAGNYAGAMAGKTEAAARGCDEALWLDARERRYVEEFGAMNCFAVSGAGADTQLLTPPLGGTILAGHTRATVLQLANRRGITAREQPIALDQILDPDGPITEIFACGTAAGIAPVRRIASDTGAERVISDRPGPVTSALASDYDNVTRGRIEAEPGWTIRVDDHQRMERN
jgi:branched-chain amino acid aminotransferase